MALRTYYAAKNASGSSATKPVVDQTTAMVAAAATVATDVATLVSDGASPTQGHVTTLNTDWGVLNTELAAQASQALGGVTVIFDNAAITSVGDIRKLLNAIADHLGGDSRFTV